MRHVGEASFEEFIDGEEFTYDTVCIGGKPAFENVAQYLPQAARSRARNEWISPVIITVRDLDAAGARRRASRSAAACSTRSAWATASPTWSGSSSRTARSCSARSAAARAARTSSIR